MCALLADGEQVVEDSREHQIIDAANVVTKRRQFLSQLTKIFRRKAQHAAECLMQLNKRFDLGTLGRHRIGKCLLLQAGPGYRCSICIIGQLLDTNRGHLPRHAGWRKLILVSSGGFAADLLWNLSFQAVRAANQNTTPSIWGFEIHTLNLPLYHQNSNSY